MEFARSVRSSYAGARVSEKASREPKRTAHIDGSQVLSLALFDELDGPVGGLGVEFAARRRLLLHVLGEVGL